MEKTIAKRRGPTDVDILIGKQLRTARKQRTLSCQSLGQRTGISFQQILKYETGENRISCARLLDFAIILEKPLEYFYITAAEKYNSLDAIDTIGNRFSDKDIQYINEDTLRNIVSGFVNALAHEIKLTSHKSK